MLDACMSRGSAITLVQALRQLILCAARWGSLPLWLGLCRSRITSRNRARKRLLQLEQKLQQHMDVEDRRVKELTEGILYDFLPAALNVILPHCEDPLQELDADRCRVSWGAGWELGKMHAWRPTGADRDDDGPPTCVASLPAGRR